ncbi:ribosome assembly 3 [Ceratocystis lukuohia]|uniref:Ribosome assembly protein 3 n=3 Tax=Ceratocystis TaxID=5157 RepID=A0A0F8DKD6_CERFI|nr:hypothetical protein CFO_g1285 [Ceratocystis platani]PHH56194.1 hypothetical protein CFIMG_007204RA00001 [Ceratocystis fimbriata CBS 114723]
MPNPITNDVFSAYYLQRTTNELAEDLDRVRAAEDFKADSIQLLVHALQQGAATFTSTEQQRVAAATKEETSNE